MEWVEGKGFVHELGEQVVVSTGGDMPWEYTKTGIVVGLYEPKIEDTQVIHYLIAFDKYKPRFAITDTAFAGKFEECYVWNYNDYMGKPGEWFSRGQVKYMEKK